MEEVEKGAHIGISQSIETSQSHEKELKDFIRRADEIAGTKLHEDIKIEEREVNEKHSSETYQVLTINSTKVAIIREKTSFPLPNLSKLNRLLEEQNSNHFFYSYTYNKSSRDKNLFTSEKDYFENKMHIMLEKY